MQQERRTFLKLAFFGITALMNAMLAVPVLGYLIGPLVRKRERQWLEVGPVSEFGAAAPPKAKRLRYTSTAGFRPVETAENVWVCLLGAEFVVYSSECTHVGCNVIWKNEGAGIESAQPSAADEGHFFCPCHGGKFDIAGTVLDGPPPAPLTRKSTKVEQGKLFIEV